ncbi:hypothetical protein ACI6Q2_04300 [Chitinophagaceae bacterium LWZ2-11]
MKKWLAILLLSIYLFGATDAYQLLKFPLLVKHYIKHKSENPDITILAFLKIHYIDKQEIDADYQQDMQLPFKKHETECCLSIATILPAPIEIDYKSPVKIVRTKYKHWNDNVPAFLTIKSVFQPPKAIA